MKAIRLICCALVLLMPASGMLLAMGTEDFGNAPMNDVNYKDWPGIVPVINLPSRVYHNWVNGNEHFYFRGDTAALNDAIQKFAAIETPKHEILLRPGPTTITTFDGSRTFAFDWELHIVGGISSHLAKLDKGDRIWSQSPTLTIYLTEDIRLEKLDIPKGVTVLELADMKARYRESQTSSDITVRGWGAGELAQLDPYDNESLSSIIKLLDDKDPWVHLNAIGTLPAFGKKAEIAIPALQNLTKAADDNLKAEIEKSIERIRSSQPKPETEREHEEGLRVIHDFLQSHKQE